jgi:hypothetical protein
MSEQAARAAKRRERERGPVGCFEDDNGGGGGDGCSSS